MSNQLSNFRKNYQTGELIETTTSKNPFVEFKKWFDRAKKTNVIEVNAMVLATATDMGKPSARMVLLKGYGESGFVFYTNYQSRKGRELLKNPNAALLFYWDVLEQQIRIEGKVHKVSVRQSDDYFQCRPKGSQIGAHASPQSQVIESRQVLLDNMAQLQEEHQHTTSLPRPEYWGGFVLQPHTFEFWQGRPNRLHDRIQYILQTSGDWTRRRLAP